MRLRSLSKRNPFVNNYKMKLNIWRQYSNNIKNEDLDLKNLRNELYNIRMEHMDKFKSFSDEFKDFKRENFNDDSRVEALEDKCLYLEFLIVCLSLPGICAFLKNLK